MRSVHSKVLVATMAVSSDEVKGERPSELQARTSKFDSFQELVHSGDADMSESMTELISKVSRRWAEQSETCLEILCRSEIDRDRAANVGVSWRVQGVGEGGRGLPFLRAQQHRRETQRGEGQREGMTFGRSCSEGPELQHAKLSAVLATQGEPSKLLVFSTRNPWHHDMLPGRNLRSSISDIL